MVQGATDWDTVTVHQSTLSKDTEQGYNKKVRTRMKMAMNNQGDNKMATEKEDEAFSFSVHDEKYTEMHPRP